ncbi:hypothetical protein BDN72DRAFT_895980 [Pluteus cervinus]|uniref:Uncharacterized protein n=1 Tax=Pluteus cervinus TaxID=181527 RepID=A0ACD3AZG8_9AGAR|nr:hypothetical protein BDN72DRAFT_895980 [Pluteus cervinus]
MTPNITFTAWRGVVATFHLLAFMVTSWRIVHRKRTRGLWWDDYWALFGLLLDIVYFATLWMRVPAGASIPQSRGVTLFWLTTTFFPTVVWAARISIGFSILRFVPRQTSSKTRKTLHYLLVLFGLFWLALMLEKWITCGGNKAWEHTKAVQCTLGQAVGIITLVTDVIGDGSLIFASLFIFWSANLHSGQKLLVLSILCSSIFSTMAGIVYAVFVFQADSLGANRGLLISLTANIKAAITLLVCNMFVVTMAVHKLRGHHEDMETPAVSQVTEDTESKGSLDEKIPA